jgi:hypothetical protein
MQIRAFARFTQNYAVRVSDFVRTRSSNDERVRTSKVDAVEFGRDRETSDSLAVTESRSSTLRSEESD